MPLTLSLGAATLAAIALTASACGSSHTSPVTVNSKFVTQSRLIEDGTIRCTATVLTTPVRAGQELGKTRVRFTFHNLTKRQVELRNGWQEGSAVVRSPDGTTYDPLWIIERSPGQMVFPTPIAPGATTKGTVSLPRVSWEGPLRITPSCGDSTLEPVQVAVTSPGLPASPRAAVTQVVAATGHLLDHCRPRTPGVSVVGRIEPPRGHELPPFRARCSVSLRREGDFYRAQVLVVTPPSLRGVHVLPTYEQLRGPDTWYHNTQKIAWQFVVTRSGATPISAFVGDSATLTSRWAVPGQEANGNVWCGGTRGAGGGHNLPPIGFLTSNCVPSPP